MQQKSIKHKEVKEYAVIFKKDGSTAINLFFEDDTWHSMGGLDPARALQLTDLLRNEKPLYWSKGPHLLWTGREPVGEGEISQEATSEKEATPGEATPGEATPGEATDIAE